MTVCRLRLIAAILLLTAVKVTNAGIAEDWEAGKQAFRSGDFRSAIVYFEMARDAGMSGPAVHYNIAVSQYRLRRYEDAGETFSLIAERFPKMRGLAEYNLGLVARRLGRDRQATEHFLRAYELSPDNREIRVLASGELREMQPEVQLASRWRGAIGVRGGYDDNVVLRDENTLSPGSTTDSSMFDVFAIVEGPWRADGGLRLQASAYLVRYPDAEQFEQTELRAGALYDWRSDDWRIEAGAHAGAGTLGGEDFDREFGGSLRLLRHFGRNAAVDARFIYDEIRDADSLFPGIEGSRQQFDLRYRWYRSGHRIQLRYWMETNDRQDPGVSPDRQRYSADYRYQPDRGIGWETGIDFRTSDYEEVVTPREEDLTTLRAALTWRLPADWLTMIEYRQADNDSTDEFFAYDRQQITIGAMKLF